MYCRVYSTFSIVTEHQNDLESLPKQIAPLKGLVVPYLSQNGGAFSDPTIAWLNWQFNGDEEAASMSKGEKCGLCMDIEWKIETKNID